MDAKAIDRHYRPRDFDKRRLQSPARDGGLLTSTAPGAFLGILRLYRVGDFVSVGANLTAQLHFSHPA
jgi:hypothetical protein